MALKIATITVTTSGTRVPLAATSTPVRWFAVQPTSTNTLNIYIGDSTVSHSGPTGISLAPSAAPFQFPPAGGAGAVWDLALVFADADTSGNSFSLVYLL